VKTLNSLVGISIPILDSAGRSTSFISLNSLVGIRPLAVGSHQLGGRYRHFSIPLLGSECPFCGYRWLPRVKLSIPLLGSEAAERGDAGGGSHVMLSIPLLGSVGNGRGPGEPRRKLLSIPLLGSGSNPISSVQELLDLFSQFPCWDQMNVLRGWRRGASGYSLNSLVGIRHLTASQSSS